MPVHGAQHRPHVLCLKTRSREQPRQEMVDEHVLAALHVFAGVGRLLARYALAPPLAIGGDGFQQQDVALGLHAKRRLEGRHQRQADTPHLDRKKLHALRLSSRAHSSSDSSISPAATFSSSWWRLEAPGIAPTLGFRISQARQTFARVALWRSPISRTAAVSRARPAPVAGLELLPPRLNRVLRLPSSGLPPSHTRPSRL